MADPKKKTEEGVCQECAHPFHGTERCPIETESIGIFCECEGIPAPTGE